MINRSVTQLVNEEKEGDLEVCSVQCAVFERGGWLGLVKWSCSATKGQEAHSFAKLLVRWGC